MPYAVSTVSAVASPQDNKKLSRHTERGAEHLPIKWQLAVFAVAFAARASYVLAQNRWDVVAGSFQSGDAVLYDELARSLLAGDGLATSAGPTAYVMPGYPLFLAACYYVGGTGIGHVGIVQSALGALACLFVGRSAALLFVIELDSSPG